MRYFFIFLLSATHLIAQDHYWYFGNAAGLVFKSNTTQILTDGEMYTDEACASVSDAQDRLLFYTNGVKVWNYKHQIINGVDLQGTKSSTSIAVCSKPGSNDEFYIFTTDEKGGSKGLTYSILKIEDLNLGKTADRMKSQAFYTPDLINRNLRYTWKAVNQNIISELVSEKVALTMHDNGKDVWIVTHLWNSNKFVSIRLTENGFQDRVESAVGVMHNNALKTNGSEAIGVLKFSPNGKQLASVVSYRNNAPVELFDMDIKTGKITLNKSYLVEGVSYGLEFSPDQSKLYVSFLMGPYNLVQIDLLNGKITPLSKKIDHAVSYGALQLGPDQKIYAAKTHSSMDVIEKPNGSALTCSYKESFIDLKNRFCVYGLPVKPLLRYSAELKKSTYQNVEALLDQDKNSKKSNISSNVNCESKLKDTTVSCIGVVTLDAGGQNVTYEWSTNEKTRSISIKESNYYSVTVTGDGCREVKRVYVKFESRPTNFSVLPNFIPLSAFNNYFAYSINDVNDFHLTVMNGSDKVMFETFDTVEKWKGLDKKGKPVKSGKYFWQVEYTPKCGKEKIKKSGEVKVLNK